MRGSRDTSKINFLLSFQVTYKQIGVIKYFNAEI